MTLINDLFSYTHVYFLKHKKEVVQIGLRKFKEFVNVTTYQSENKVMKLYLQIIMVVNIAQKNL